MNNVEIQKSRYTNCMIINCVRDSSEQLYHQLAYYKLIDIIQSPIQVVAKEIGKVEDFLVFLDELSERITLNKLNLWIHLFSHGNDRGLHFNETTILTWAQMAEKFANINKALDSKLFVNFTCCKGISMKEMIKYNSNSFAEIVGSSNDLEIREAEFFNAIFYKDFAKVDSNENRFQQIKPILEYNNIQHIQYFKATANFELNKQH